MTISNPDDDWAPGGRQEKLWAKAEDAGYYLISHGGEWLLVDFGAGNGSWTEYPTLDEVEQYLADEQGIVIGDADDDDDGDGDGDDDDGDGDGDVGDVPDKPLFPDKQPPWL